MNTLMRNFYDIRITAQHEQSWAIIIGSYVLDCILVILLLFFVYPISFFSSIEEVTNGIINSTLIGSLALSLVILVFMIRIGGKVKFSHLGLVPSHLPKGLLIYGGVYVLLNLTLLIINWIVRTRPIWYPYWEEVGSFSIAFGYLLAQIFGNVLFEEVYFRGFLWAQLSIKFTNLFRNKPVLGLNIGALVSNLLFALLHIPVRILNGLVGWDLLLSLLIVFGLGFLFTFVYLITENLFASMAIHILLNVSFVFFNPIFDASTLCLIITGVLMVVWLIIKLQKHKSQKAQS
ncbi:MAG: CPBP family intramembrane metalloprotease [Candidatus Lokiarchaeota archaeon]|nr:CPBP family intramembrane metalloprotease [Candidatus Lokiarchaeota archaeon]